MKLSGVASFLIMISTVSCTTMPKPELRQAQGKITMLRVHDIGTGFGPKGDQIDVEVVIKLNSLPGNAFGFQLQGDSTLAAHQRMLELLRLAFNDNLKVAVDYEITPQKKNGLIKRAWLPPPEPIVKEVPTPIDMRDDPAAQPGRLDPSVLDDAPVPTPEFKNKGAFDLMEETDWLPLVEAVIEPGGSHSIPISFAEPVLLLSRTEWDGAQEPVKVAVKKDGTTLANGEPYHISPDQGSVIISIEINTAGSAIVEITNIDNRPVNVQSIVGTLPLSLGQD